MYNTDSFNVNIQQKESKSMHTVLTVLYSSFSCFLFFLGSIILFTAVIIITVVVTPFFPNFFEMFDRHPGISVVLLVIAMSIATLIKLRVIRISKSRKEEMAVLRISFPVLLWTTFNLMLSTVDFASTQLHIFTFLLLCIASSIASCKIFRM